MRTRLRIGSALALLAFVPAKSAFAQAPAFVASTKTWEPYSPAELPPPEPEKPWVKNTQGFVLGLDFGGAVPVETPLAKESGLGGNLRLGYRFAIGPVWIAPEAVGGIVSFPRYETALVAGGGGRVGLDLGRFEPAVYLYGGGFSADFKSGWGLRSGAALDVRALRFLSPGVHVDYNLARWDRDGRVMYMAVGAHLGFVL